ncbi:MAG: hypothetical protein R3F37_04040 [Candidatus Competibacteraceae bacterium]
MINGKDGRFVRGGAGQQVPGLSYKNGGRQSRLDQYRRAQALLRYRGFRDRPDTGGAERRRRYQG